MTKLFIPQETHLVNVSYPQFASSFFAACVLWFDTKSVDCNLLVDFTRAENRAWEIVLLIKQNKTTMGTVNKIDFFLMVQSYFWCNLITVVTCDQMQLTPRKPPPNMQRVSFCFGLLMRGGGLQRWTLNMEFFTVFLTIKQSSRTSRFSCWASNFGSSLALIGNSPRVIF